MNKKELLKHIYKIIPKTASGQSSKKEVRLGNIVRHFLDVYTLEDYLPSLLHYIDYESFYNPIEFWKQSELEYLYELITTQ